MMYFLRAYHSGFCTDISFDCLLLTANQTLFKSFQSNDRCVHSISPEIKVTHYNFRDRGHELVLPDYKTLLYKSSILFVIYFKLYDNIFFKESLILNLMFCFCIIFLNCVNVY
jgi:hypothetical protein